MKRWVILASSALVYGLALIMSPALWWCSFICFVPLFLLGARHPLTFKEGFFYSGLLWALGGIGILQTLFILGTGPLWVRIIPSIAIVLIQAFFGGLWFFLTSTFLSRALISSPYQRLGIWVLTTGLYFYWVIHLSLSMFDYWEGYFLLYPLLPLAEYPALLSWMPVTGKGILMWFLLLSNAAFTLPMLTNNSLIRFLCPLIGIVPWVLQIAFAQPPQTPPDWVHKVAVIQKKFFPVPQPMESIEKIKDTIKDLITAYADLELFILPESSLTRLNLDTARELATYWDTQSIGKPVTILLGAFKWEHEVYRNTVYWISEGQIQGSFNKRHTMAVTESVGWYNMSFLRTLFHGRGPIVEPSSNPRVPFPLLPEMSFVPYVCSELFFNNQPDDQYPQTVIAELSNDFWAKSAYIRHLMYLAARFKAIEWQRPILYASYYYKGFIDTDGTRTPLR